MVIHINFMVIITILSIDSIESVVSCTKEETVSSSKECGCIQGKCCLENWETLCQCNRHFSGRLCEYPVMDDAIKTAYATTLVITWPGILNLSNFCVVVYDRIMIDTKYSLKPADSIVVYNRNKTTVLTIPDLDSASKLTACVIDNSTLHSYKNWRSNCLHRSTAGCFEFETKENPAFLVAAVVSGIVLAVCLMTIYALNLCEKCRESHVEKGNFSENWRWRSDKRKRILSRNVTKENRNETRGGKRVSFDTNDANPTETEIVEANGEKIRM